jgi:hypothetical protein
MLQTHGGGKPKRWHYLSLAPREGTNFFELEFLTNRVMNFGRKGLTPTDTVIWFSCGTGAKDFGLTPATDVLFEERTGVIYKRLTSGDTFNEGIDIPSPYRRQHNKPRQSGYKFTRNKRTVWLVRPLTNLTRDQIQHILEKVK